MFFRMEKRNEGKIIFQSFSSKRSFYEMFFKYGEFHVTWDDGAERRSFRLD